MRVALLGDVPDVASWMRSLGARGADVVQVRDEKELLGLRPNWGILFGPHEQAAAQLARMALAPEAPPLAVLVSRADGLHPQTRLLQALAGAKREWEGTFDALTDPLAVLGPAGNLVRVNRAFASMLGRAWNDLLGRMYTDFLQPLPKGSPDPITASLAARTGRTQEVELADIRGRWLLTTAPLESHEGPPGLVVILKEVTALKEQQERLLLAARLRDVGRLAGGVAHEINTPLASISLRAESLLKLAEDPRLQEVEGLSKLPRYLKTIVDETQRCKRIVAALLEFSRSGPSALREVNMNEVAQRTVDLLSHDMKRKQLRLELRLQPALPAVLGDESRLSQALLALTVNAMEAGRAGGRVELATAADEDGIVVTVSDDGVGIPPENLEKVFTPFFTTKPPAQATGLGLAVVHGVVGSHGGSVHIESEAGRGTKVRVWLPLPDRPVNAR